MADSVQEPSDSVQEHRAAASGRIVRCAVLTVSDTRTEATDEGGTSIRQALQDAGHRVVASDLLPDDPARIRPCLEAWLAQPEIEAIVLTGGTGVSRRDVTVEVVEGLVDQPLPGFGELFRMLSWQQVGSAALLSRATAGLAGDTFLFALPGSVKAVGLAMEQLILPELRHLVEQRRG